MHIFHINDTLTMNLNGCHLVQAKKMLFLQCECHHFKYQKHNECVFNTMWHSLDFLGNIFKFVSLLLLMKNQMLIFLQKPNVLPFTGFKMSLFSKLPASRILKFVMTSLFFTVRIFSQLANYCLFLQNLFGFNCMFLLQHMCFYH